MVYSYVFTFAILMTVMTNACQYFYWHQPQKPDLWGRWAPVLLLSCATVLLLLPPLKNLLVNVCMSSFRQNGFDPTIEQVLDLAYLPVFSERLLRFYTALGYALMLWGTALQVDLRAKVLKSFGAACAKAAPKSAFRATDGL